MKTPIILRVLAQVFEVNRLLVVGNESLYLSDQQENALKNEFNTKYTSKFRTSGVENRDSHSGLTRVRNPLKKAEVWSRICVCMRKWAIWWM